MGRLAEQSGVLDTDRLFQEMHKLYHLILPLTQIYGRAYILIFSPLTQANGRPYILILSLLIQMGGTPYKDVLNFMIRNIVLVEEKTEIAVLTIATVFLIVVAMIFALLPVAAELMVVRSASRVLKIITVPAVAVRTVCA